MDLLSALPEEVFEEIATYFDGNDVLESSLVCKSWYQKFAQSKECMKTITAKYTAHNQRNDLNVLLSSNRKYQNIKIGFQLTQYMKDSKIEENILAILKKFAGTIVTLNTSHDFQRICNLPKLKEIQFNNTNMKYYYKNTNYFYSNGLLSKSTDIQSLSILSPRNLDETSIKIIQKSLAGMRFLKSLRVNQGGIFENLKSDDCRFKLEKVELLEHDTDLFYMNFLITQQSTLKIIKLTYIELRDLAIILTAFPNLHTLKYRALFSKDMKKIDVPQNATIKTLIVISETSEDFKVYPRLKNLKYLKLDSLSWKIFCAASRCPKLITIEYRDASKITREQEKSINTAMEKNRNLHLIKRRKDYVY